MTQDHREKERAEFEAWLNQDHSRGVDSVGDYVDDTVYSMFAAWKAARRALAVTDREIPPGCALVPIKPTNEMLAKAGEVEVDGDFGRVQVLFHSELFAFGKS